MSNEQIEQLAKHSVVVEARKKLNRLHFDVNWTTEECHAAQESIIAAAVAKVCEGERELVSVAYKLAATTDRQAELRQAKQVLVAELAERAVVALHMHFHAGTNKPGFDDCRIDLCGSWHSLANALAANERKE